MSGALDPIKTAEKETECVYQALSGMDIKKIVSIMWITI